MAAVHPSMILVLTIAFWFCQPLMMQILVIRRSRSQILLAVVIFLVVTLFLGSNLHNSLSDRPKPIRIRPVFFILLWYPPAMQLIRYLHAFAVGGKEFARHFGLTNFSRVAAFTLSVPAVQFSVENGKGDDNSAKSFRNCTNDGSPRRGQKFPTCDDSLLWHDFLICCLDLAITVVGCGFILYTNLDVLLPDWIQRIIRVYIMGFSTTIIKLLLEIPSRIVLRKFENVAHVIPIYDRPYLTCSPRDLWRRWSVTAGYHYRKGIYEPFLLKIGDPRSKKKSYFSIFLATMLPFFINCVLHIFWWSIVVKGDIDYSYVYLLFIFPVASFLMEDVVVGRLIFSPSDSTIPFLHPLANYLVVVIGFYFIGEMMSDAHALPSTLTAVCRANVGLPIIPE